MAYGRNSGESVITDIFFLLENTSKTKIVAFSFRDIEMKISHTLIKNIGPTYS